MSEPGEGVAVYEVEARDPAQALCRMLGLFAQQDRALTSVIAQSEGDRMHVMLRLGGIDARRAAVLAEKLRAQAMVERIEFTFSPVRASAPRCRLRRAHDAQHVAAGHLANVVP